jgi:hypothetical protein
MVNIPVEELEALKAKNRAQAREITYLSEVLARKNLDLDALHLVTEMTTVKKQKPL